MAWPAYRFGLAEARPAGTRIKSDSKEEDILSEQSPNLTRPSGLQTGYHLVLGHGQGGGEVQEFKALTLGIKLPLKISSWAQALLIWMVVMLESWPVSLSFLNVVTATLHEIRNGKYLEHLLGSSLK